MSRKRIGWVVDAQVDFMSPQGRLYVKDLDDDADEGSVQIEGTLASAVAWMRKTCDALVYTGDWHALEDAEIDPISPDPAAGTYPPHCLGRSDDPDERAGAQIIESIRPRDPVVLEIDADAARAAEVAEAAANGETVFIHKTRFDVFTGNPAAEAFLAGLVERLGGDVEIVVAGVARDVCVTQAVDGMQARSYDVIALSDATWGLGLEPEEVTLARWAAKGRVRTLAELVTG